MNAVFAQRIEQWYSIHHRDLPWRNTTNPYHIWLSEIILQQTRVEQGMSYYFRFIQAFPLVSDLANATEDDVMKLWQGLGYYSRARNLHKAAKMIAEAGDFPREYTEVVALPGIGHYTAAAICSFAYHLPYAVLDGNVFRVLSRYLGIDTPIDTTIGKKLFQQLAQEMLDKQHPAEYNQAIMDFGALVCKPSSPSCEECPLQENCHAFATDTVRSLPVKNKRVQVRDRYFCYFFLETTDGQVYLKCRSGKDIWKGLYEFYLQEAEAPLPLGKIAELFPQSEITLICEEYVHLLTHQRIHTDFYKVKVTDTSLIKGGVWIPKDRLSEYALPQLLVVLMKKMKS